MAAAEIFFGERERTRIVSSTRSSGLHGPINLDPARSPRSLPAMGFKSFFVFVGMGKSCSAVVMGGLWACRAHGPKFFLFRSASIVGRQAVWQGLNRILKIM